MIAEAYGLRFLDAGTVAQMSALDGEHLDPDGHKKLAAAIADIVRRDLGQFLKDLREKGYLLSEEAGA